MARSFFSWSVGLAKRGAACRKGVATTEAAFIAPIFVLAGLAVLDLGLAGAQRMQLDQALRAGAQLSMINVTDESEIRTATLAALGETATGVVDDDGVCEANASCITVSYECECGGAASACTSLCPTTQEIPSAYLTIVASRRHEGLLFGDRSLSTHITVQTR